MQSDPAIARAAQAIRAADSLLIGAGAGMGVDSGLPDFRGPQGFWSAYPPYQKLGLHFTDVANPRWFATDPALAWGFYGHRFQLYRTTPPHEGYDILRRWVDRLRHGAFVFTSNVDGHFQRAGFAEESVVECHGSIHWLQCTQRCGHDIWPIDPGVTALIDLDKTTMRARRPFPACPGCGGLARPNILMFGDWQWDEARTADQQARMQTWLQNVDAMRLIVVECGAGTAIPTVRHFCERVAAAANAPIIRINARDPDVPAGQIGLAMGARAALQAIDASLPSAN